MEDFCLRRPSLASASLSTRQLSTLGATAGHACWLVTSGPLILPLPQRKRGAHLEVAASQI